MQFLQIECAILAQSPKTTTLPEASRTGTKLALLLSMLKKILLIDDEPDVLYVSRISLSSVGGWSVISTHDGTEALLLAKKEKPNLILLDVVMGPISGLDIFLELQRD